MLRLGARWCQYRTDASVTLRPVTADCSIASNTSTPRCPNHLASLQSDSTTIARGRNTNHERIRIDLGLPQRRVGMPDLGSGEAAASVLRHPRQAHPRVVGRYRRPRNLGFSGSRGKLRPVRIRPAGGGTAASRGTVRPAHRGYDRLDGDYRRTRHQPPQRRQGWAGWRLLGREHGRKLPPPAAGRAVSCHRRWTGAKAVAGLRRVQWTGMVARRAGYVSLRFHIRDHRGLGLRPRDRCHVQP